MLRPFQDRKYPYILLLAAMAVLAIGLILKPNQQEQKAPPSETELAQLQRLTQQRRLQDLSSYLTDAANQASSSLVFVRPSQQSGVLWDSRPLIVSARDPRETGAGRASTTVTPDGRSVPVQPIPLQSGAPFAAFSLGQTVRTRVGKKTPKPPDLGDWVLAVARTANGSIVFAHGIYQGAVGARCGAFAYRSLQSSAPVSAALLGGGAFTLDGQLLGVIAECEQKPIVIAVESVAEILRQPPSMNRRLEDYYGIRVSDELPVRPSPAAGAVQVISLWAHSRGQEAGLRPGDIITAADGQPVQSRGDLEALVAGDQSEHQLDIQRRRRRLAITLSADPGLQSVPTAYGMTLGQRLKDGQVSVAEVAAGSTAQHAGILAGDLLLQVGATPLPDAASAARALNDAKAARLLTLERDGRRYEVLLQP